MHFHILVAKMSKKRLSNGPEGFEREKPSELRHNATKRRVRWNPERYRFVKGILLILNRAP
jgi:hypothetical protein